MVLAQFRIKPGAHRFSLNLQYGTDFSNIALHFNPRFDENLVVINTRVDGRWMTETRIPLLEKLMQKDTDVETRFVLVKEDIHIFVNGVWFTSFPTHSNVFDGSPDTFSVVASQRDADIELNRVSFL